MANFPVATLYSAAKYIMNQRNENGKHRAAATDLGRCCLFPFFFAGCQLLSNTNNKAAPWRRLCMAVKVTVRAVAEIETALLSPLGRCHRHSVRLPFAPLRRSNLRFLFANVQVIDPRGSSL